MKDFETLQLSDYAIKFLYREAQPVFAEDFIGYITRYSAKSNIGLGVDLTGHVYIFSLTKKPFSEKKVNRIIKRLIRTNFLEYGIEPFPEFSEKFNLQFDIYSATIVDGPCFRRVY